MWKIGERMKRIVCQNSMDWSCSLTKLGLLDYDLPRCGRTTWRTSSRRSVGLSPTSTMLPWTQNSQGSLQDPLESSSQHQTTSIRSVKDNFKLGPWLFLGRSCQSLQLLRCNVDLLKIIQLGLTFFNKEGGTPEGVCTWQVKRPIWLFSQGFLPTVSFSVQFQVQPVRGHVCWGQCWTSAGFEQETTLKGFWCLICTEFRHPIWAPWEGGNWNCSLCWDPPCVWHCPPW